MDHWLGRRVLVTGHTGFKGSWLCEWLLGMGADIQGYAIGIPTSPSLFEGLKLTTRLKDGRGDIRDFQKLQSVFRSFQPEVVFHLAAQPLVRRSFSDPIETFSTNVMGTANLLECLRCEKSAKACVIVTTDKVYENPERGLGFVESEPLGGHDPYSASKACAEIVSASYQKSFFRNELFIATARAGNVIGGGDWAEDRLIPDLYRHFVSQKVVRIRNPDAVRPWQHVLEPIGAYVMLAESLLLGKSSEAWNFGPESNDEIKVIDLVHLSQKNLSAPLKYEVSLDFTKTEARTLRLDINKAKERLGWRPKLNIHQAIRWTWEWYMEFEKTSPLDLTRKQIHEYQKTK